MNDMNDKEKIAEADKEKQKEVLRLVDKLAKMIRYDQKRKRILMGNYQGMIEHIKKILEK